MKIFVNGEEKEAPNGVTVYDYVKALGFDPETVVVELDGQILARTEYPSSHLNEACELELIRFIGGG